MTFQYQIPSSRTVRFNLNRLDPPRVRTDPEPLTGWVNGLEASDIEERYARALRNRKIDFILLKRMVRLGTLGLLTQLEMN
jgi:hypothetical protein